MASDQIATETLSMLVKRVIGGGTPLRSVASFWNGDISWASVKDFSDDSIDLFRTAESITPMGLSASASNLIDAGIPIVCTRMAVGRCAAPVNAVAINQDLKALVPDDHVHSRFLLYALKRLQPTFESQAVGSTVKGITLRQLLSVPIEVPPLSEQRRIAEILDTLNEAIRKTEQVIAKLRQMNQGLLHDLLTRGIDENGELRTPSADSCKKEWVRAPLRNFLYPVREPGMCGLPTVAVTLKDGLVPRGINERRVHTELRPEQHLLVKKGDIAYNMMRMWQGACGIAEYDCMVSPAYVVLRMKLELRPRFAYLLFKSPEMIAAFLVHSRGITSDRYRLYPDDMLRIMASIPSNPNEQERISDVADTFDAKIQKERLEAQKLHKIMHGLMDDLLSGRVRVNATEEKAS